MSSHNRTEPTLRSKLIGMKEDLKRTIINYNYITVVFGLGRKDTWFTSTLSFVLPLYFYIVIIIILLYYNYIANCKHGQHVGKGAS